MLLRLLFLFCLLPSPSRAAEEFIPQQITRFEHEIMTFANKKNIIFSKDRRLLFIVVETTKSVFRKEARNALFKALLLLEFAPNFSSDILETIELITLNSPWNISEDATRTIHWGAEWFAAWDITFNTISNMIFGDENLTSEIQIASKQAIEEGKSCSEVVALGLEIAEKRSFEKMIENAQSFFENAYNAAIKFSPLNNSHNPFNSRQSLLEFEKKLYEGIPTEAKAYVSWIRLMDCLQSKALSDFKPGFGEERSPVSWLPIELVDYIITLNMLIKDSKEHLCLDEQF